MAKQMDDDEEIATMRANFRALRQARGWTIEDLSKISRISEKVLADIEEGRDFKIDYLLRLCMLYGIKPAKIFAEITVP